jgi:hypothetical protein
MTLLTGGGSLKLRTEEIENGQPSDLLVLDRLSFTVLEPIPEPEPEPNIIQNIQFLGVPAYGANLEIGLGNRKRNQFYSKEIVLNNLVKGTLKYRIRDKWAEVQIRRWNGIEWESTHFSVWNGTSWSQ